MNINLVTQDEIQQMKTELLEQIQSSQKTQKLKWLRSKEVRDHFGISNTTLTRLKSQGIITFSYLNGTVFYDLESIYNELEKNKIPCKNCK